MRTAIDTSVLMDLILDDPSFCLLSKAALKRARDEGALLICDTVVAELVPALGLESTRELLSDLQISYVPTSFQSALLAGEIFASYRKRGGKRDRVIADFVIAAHAQLEADRFLARDRGFYREYFKTLKIFEPS